MCYLRALIVSREIIIAFQKMWVRIEQLKVCKRAVFNRASPYHNKFVGQRRSMFTFNLALKIRDNAKERT